MKNLKFLSIMQLLLMIIFVVMEGLCLFEVVEIQINTLAVTVFGFMYAQSLVIHETILEIYKVVQIANKENN